MLVRLYLKSDFLINFKKIPKCQVLWKFVQCEPSFSMRTDRHGEIHGRFFQIAKLPKRCNTTLY